MTEGRRISEEAAVFVVYNEGWEIGMGVCEFVEEFAVEGAVDGCPERVTSVDDFVDGFR